MFGTTCALDGWRKTSGSCSWYELEDSSCVLDLPQFLSTACGEAFVVLGILGLTLLHTNRPLPSRYNKVIYILAETSCKMAWITGNTGNSNLMAICSECLHGQSSNRYWSSWDSVYFTNRPPPKDTNKQYLLLQAVGSFKA